MLPQHYIGAPQVDSNLTVYTRETKNELRLICRRDYDTAIEMFTKMIPTRTHNCNIIIGKEKRHKMILQI